LHGAGILGIWLQGALAGFYVKVGRLCFIQKYPKALPQISADFSQIDSKKVIFYSTNTQIFLCD
jgi:hypothetical protein